MGVLEFRTTGWPVTLVLAVLFAGFGGWALHAYVTEPHGSRASVAQVQAATVLERSWHQLHGTYDPGREPVAPDGYELLRDGPADLAWTAVTSADAFCVQAGAYRFDSTKDQAPVQGVCATG